MLNFLKWWQEGQYSPFGEAFDIGETTMKALEKFAQGEEPLQCGGQRERDNGNGSLMRILPLAFHLYRVYGLNLVVKSEAMDIIHNLSALTHRHPRSQIACGLYILIAVNIIEGQALNEAIVEGLKAGQAYYKELDSFKDELSYYERLFNLETFKALAKKNIKSTAYVVDTLEASLWCLLNTENYRDCVLTAVNLGGDTDTIGAIAGGLAGLYYGSGKIPVSWLDEIVCKELIENLIAKFASSLVELPHRTSDNLVMHPVFSRLRQEIAELKVELAELLEEHDELVFHVCKNIEVDYMVKLGALEYKVFELQCQVLRLKRKIELMQRAINRQEEINLGEIEKILDKEYRIYMEGLRKKAKNLAEAMERMGRVALSDLSSRELKALYREIVKRLHPDLNPDLTPDKLELFKKAIEAYKDADLDRLKTLALLLEDLDGELDFSGDDLERLEEKKKEYLAKRLEIFNSINKVKASFPYNQKDLLKDEVYVQREKNKLNQMVIDYQEALEHLNDIYQEMMGGKDD